MLGIGEVQDLELVASSASYVLCNLALCHIMPEKPAALTPLVGSFKFILEGADMVPLCNMLVFDVPVRRIPETNIYDIAISVRILIIMHRRPG